MTTRSVRVGYARMIALRAFLFKSLRVVTAEGVPLDLGSPTTRSLFACLLLRRSQLSDRRKLAFLFWPDGDESSARRNLRIYLHHVRRALEDALPPTGPGPEEPMALLLADGSNIRINPHVPLWVDVEAFTHAARPSASLEELRSAAALYTGDLLEDSYAEWCEEERRQLHNTYLNVLSRLAQALQNAGAWDEAVFYGKKLAAEEPFDEQVHRQLIGLYALKGERSRAIQHYRSLAESLQRELGAEPLPETRALYQSLQNTAVPIQEPLARPTSAVLTTAAAPKLPIVGRKAEIASLEQALQDARQGSGSFLLISGESGIGKTRLLQEYLARHPGMLTLQGMCNELEAMAAYAPLRSLLAQSIDLLPEAAFQPPPAWLPAAGYLLPALAQRFPYLSSLNGKGLANSNINEALSSLVRAVSAQAGSEPMHIVLDDLHWADGPTWDFLAVLARLAGSAGLLIMGLCRMEDLPPERRRLIRTLERNRLSRHIPLQRLTVEETAELAKQLAPTLCTDRFFIRRLHQESDGNPFFIVEMVKSMHEAGLASVSDCATPEPDQAAQSSLLPAIPLSIREVIEARLDRLEPASQELIKVSAAIGHPFTLSLLEEIGQAPAERVIGHIEEWLARGLVREASQAYDFSHEKIRQVAYVSLSQARRQYIHRRIGEVFEHSIPPADAVTLAHHFARSDQPLKALPHLTRAGEQALRVRSYEEARHFGMRAISMLGRMPGPRQRIERIDLNLQLAQAYSFTGDRGRALEILSETEHLAVSMGDEQRLGKIFYRTAQIFWLRGQPEAAGDYARRALRAAEELDDPYLLQAALRMLGRTGIALSAFDDAIAFLLRYVNLEKEAPRSPDLSIVLGYLGVAYARVGSWKRALEAASRGLEMAEMGPSPQAVAFARMQLGFVQADTRQWQACLDNLKLISDSMEPVAQSYDGDGSVASHQALTPLGFMLHGLQGRVVAHLGKPDQGIRMIAPVLEWAERNDFRVFHYLPRIFLAECFHLGLDDASAKRHTEQALDQARSAGNRWAAGVTLRLLAECLWRLPSPDWALVEDHLIESMHILRQIRARPDLARTYLSLRRLYDRAGQIAWAVDCHFRATSIFEELAMAEELRIAQGQAAGDRSGAVVISDMRLRGPNVSEE